MKKILNRVLLNSTFQFLAICLVTFYFILSYFMRSDFRFLLPVAFLLIAIVSIYNYTVFYYALFFALPVSTNYALGSLSLEIFSEPIMILLTGIYFFAFTTNSHIRKAMPYSPITLLLVLQIVWMCFAAIDSVDILKSVKIILAKTWFITPFYLLLSAHIKDFKNMRIYFWCFWTSLVLVSTYISIRHGMLGLTFDTINTPLHPFFINHVSYSSTIAVFAPFLLYGYAVYKENKALKTLLNYSAFLFLFAIIFSITRATWLAVAMAIVYYFIVKFKLSKFTFISIMVVLCIAVPYLVYNNNYLKYSPNYESTLYNHGDLEKHLQATYEFSDVSGVERLYRWIAAARMGYENIFSGTGPGTFYPEYKKYTSDQFVTYVSYNEEKSTTHNYFLYLWAEQGLLGLLLFITLIVYTLIKGERIYHISDNIQDKSLAMSAILSIVIMVVHLFLNELVEVDKIGCWYFVSLCIIAILDKKYFYTRKTENIDTSSL